VVRGLATGKLGVRDFWKVIFKELSIGLILGFVYGLLIGMVAHFKFSTLQLALSVGLAVVSSMSVAALVGSTVPMVFARFHIDPAVATGPFVTTAIDIISVFFYFQLATILLGL
jgi:magnesium transporter